MSAKKAANLFRIYCFMCRCGAAGYSVSMLSVKPELEQAFNQLCSDVVLHIRVVIAVHLREVADISSVSVKDGLYRYGTCWMPPAPIALLTRLLVVVASALTGISNKIGRASCRERV